MQKKHKTLFSITTEIINLKTWDKSINKSGISSIWQQLGLEGWGRDRKRQCCCDRRWQAGHLCNCDRGWYCGGTFSLGAIRANNKHPPLSPAGVCQEVWLVQHLFSKSAQAQAQIHHCPSKLAGSASDKKDQPNLMLRNSQRKSSKLLTAAEM